MTTLQHHPTHPHLTALEILERDGVDLERQLVASHPLDPAASKLPTISGDLWAAVAQELAELARGFLQVEVADVLVHGWTSYRTLVEAGDRTRGTAEIDAVDLAGRDLSLHRHPSVDVVFLDQTLATVTFDVGVEVRIEALTAIVRDGRLTSLGTGRCDVTAMLAVEGTELARAHRLVDPQLVVELGDGIPLGHPPVEGQRSVVR